MWCKSSKIVQKNQILILCNLVIFYYIISTNKTNIIHGESAEIELISYFNALHG